MTNTEQSEQTRRNLESNYNSNNNNTLSNQRGSTSNYNSDRQDVAKCPSCSKGHNLEKCPQFKSKGLDQRREFVLSQGLCFGCLKKGQLSSSCRSRMKCGECGKWHPTLLHGIKPSRRSVKQDLKEEERPPAQETPKANPATSESANTNASTRGST